MLVSQKCRYALRAVLELARRYGMGACKNAEIARTQAIPPRFLEIILGQLRRGGFVVSRRGSAGGYMLALDPAEITVGSVIRFVQGPIEPVGCIGDDATEDCPLASDCAFTGLWGRLGQCISEVCDGTTFQDLLDEEARRREQEFVPSYSI
jgi:Rrf2 family protein